MKASGFVRQDGASWKSVAGIVLLAALCFIGFTEQGTLESAYVAGVSYFVAAFAAGLAGVWIAQGLWGPQRERSALEQYLGILGPIGFAMEWLVLVLMFYAGSQIIRSALIAPLPGLATPEGLIIELSSGIVWMAVSAGFAWKTAKPLIFLPRSPVVIPATGASQTGQVEGTPPAAP